MCAHTIDTLSNPLKIDYDLEGILLNKYESYGMLLPLSMTSNVHILTQLYSILFLKKYTVPKGRDHILFVFVSLVQCLTPKRHCLLISLDSVIEQKENKITQVYFM